MGENTLNASKKHTQFEEELLKFPPILRKLALQALKADDIYTIKELAAQAGISAKDCYHMIYLQRKKGKDFYGFIRDVFRRQLESYRPRVNKRLVKEALKGSYRHMELYYKLTGDLSPEHRLEGNTTVNRLTFVLAMPRSIEPANPAIPEHKGAEDHSAIDVTPAQDSEEE